MASVSIPSMEKAPWKAALFTAIIGNFVATFALSTVTQMVPTLARSMGVSVADASWVLTAYLIMVVGFLLIAGRLGDQYGHHRIFMIGLVIYVAGALFSGLSQNLTQLIVARGIHGLGVALVVGNSLAIVTNSVPESKRGLAVGAASAGIMLGSIVGALAVASFLALFSWRWIFFATIPVATVGAVSAWRLRYMVPKERSGQDWLGVGLLVAALTVFTLSINHLHGGEGTFQEGWGYHVPMHIAALVLFILFLRWEAKATHPLIPFRYLRPNPFLFNLLANATLHMTMMGIFFLFPIMIERGLGLTPRYTATWMVAVLGLGLILSVVSGWLYDRTRWRLLCPAGLSVLALGFFLLATLQSGFTFGMLVGVGLVMAIGQGFFLTPNNTIIMSLLTSSERGFGSGLLQTTTQLGHGLGISIASVVLSLSLGGTETASPAAYVQGFQHTSLAMGGITVIGMVFAFLPLLKARRHASERVPVAGGGK